MSGSLPKHVGVVMDGNRRWARAARLAPEIGHRVGADHLGDLLRWAQDFRIEHLTVFVISADNIRKRERAEVSNLFELLTSRIPQIVESADEHWTLHVSGDQSLLPTTTREALSDAIQRTRGRPAHLTLAIGYDGRADIVEGIRQALRQNGTQIDVDAITAALPGGPNKQIDLVIRSGREVRLSGFCPWQSANAEIYVSDRMWPAFTQTDFADALAAYAGSSSARA